MAIAGANALGGGPLAAVDGAVEGYVHDSNVLAWQGEGEETEVVRRAVEKATQQMRPDLAQSVRAILGREQMDTLSEAEMDEATYEAGLRAADRAMSQAAIIGRAGDPSPETREVVEESQRRRLQQELLQQHEEQQQREAALGGVDGWLDAADDFEFSAE